MSNEKGKSKLVPRRQAQMQKIAQGEVHNRPAISKIGPRIKGIKLSADDKIKSAIRQLKTSDQAEFDTFAEADDFDVEDDHPDPTSPFEMTQMEEDYEFQEKPEVDSEEQQKQEKAEKEKEGKSAPKDAPEKGADDNQSP